MHICYYFLKSFKVFFFKFLLFYFIGTFFGLHSYRQLYRWYSTGYRLGQMDGMPTSIMLCLHVSLTGFRTWPVIRAFVPALPGCRRYLWATQHSRLGIYGQNTCDKVFSKYITSSLIYPLLWVYEKCPSFQIGRIRIWICGNGKTFFWTNYCIVNMESYKFPSSHSNILTLT